jgi:hypothetical protein
MAYLLRNNILKEDDISSTTLTGGLITIDSDNPLTNMYDRSVLRACRYSVSAGGLRTLTVNMATNQNTNSAAGQISKGLAIIGLNNDVSVINTVKCLNGATLRMQQALRIPYFRTIDGVNLRSWFVEMETVSQGAWNKLEITFTESSGGVQEDRIGVLYFGDLIEFNIAQKVDSSFVSVGTKKRTPGGQIRGNLTSSYRVMKFKTTPVSQEVYEQDFAQVNYVEGDVEPIVFLPTTNDDFFLYGPQRKLFSAYNTDSRDDNGASWEYVLNFELEEEF